MIRDRERIASVRWHRADHPRLRTIALRQGTQGPQQATRRRLPLVGVRDPHQISRSPRPLDKRRAAGDHHNAALRNLANKLVGRLWWCLQHNEPWDDCAAWPDFYAGQQPAAA